MDDLEKRVAELERKVKGLWHDVYLRQPAPEPVCEACDAARMRGFPYCKDHQSEPKCKTCGGTGEHLVSLGNGMYEDEPCPDCQPAPEPER